MIVGDKVSRYLTDGKVGEVIEIDHAQGRARVQWDSRKTWNDIHRLEICGNRGTLLYKQLEAILGTLNPPPVTTTIHCNGKQSIHIFQIQKVPNVKVFVPHYAGFGCTIHTVSVCVESGNSSRYDIVIDVIINVELKQAVVVSYEDSKLSYLENADFTESSSSYSNRAVNAYLISILDQNNGIEISPFEDNHSWF